MASPFVKHPHLQPSELRNRHYRSISLQIANTHHGFEFEKGEDLQDTFVFVPRLTRSVQLVCHTFR